MAKVVGTVLYVEDHLRVAKFYREALGLVLVDRDAGHSLLSCDDFELIVHNYSPEERTAAVGTAPAKRRVTAALRLIFAVADVSACRTAAAILGGQIDDDAPHWAGPDAVLRLGHDPEGNIFQVQPR